MADEFASLTTHILSNVTAETKEAAQNPSSETPDAIDAALENLSSSSWDSSEGSDIEESDIDSGAGRQIENLADAKLEIPRTKNEQDDDIPQLPENFEINSDTRIEAVGEIQRVGDTVVVVKAHTSGEYRILNDGTIFCLEDRTILGPLYETFGPVERPFYSIKFKNNVDLEPFVEKKGHSVFYIVPSSSYLFTGALKSKGTDASNIHDEELPLEEQEYSDDEKEAAAKRSKKKRKTTTQHPSQAAQPAQLAQPAQPTPLTAQQAQMYQMYQMMSANAQQRPTYSPNNPPPY